MSMFKLLVVDPMPEHPQFDVQVWAHMWWEGTAIPGGRWLGEWAWVGRVS